MHCTVTTSYLTQKVSVCNSGIMTPVHQSIPPTNVEIFSCPEVFHKMEGEHAATFSPQRNPSAHHDGDGRDESKLVTNESSPILADRNSLQSAASMSTMSTLNSSNDSFRGSLNAASLVRLLSSQTEKFDLLLQRNEAAQEEIRQLKQGSDWLRSTCESLQQSEAQKTSKINLLEKRVQDLEKLVVDMKLKEAESRSREDHYKLQIANLQQLLESGMEPRRQRNGGLRFTQSFTLSSDSNARIGNHPKGSPPLTRSFSSFFKKSDKSSDDTLKLAVSKMDIGSGNTKGSGSTPLDTGNQGESTDDAAKEGDRQLPENIAASTQRWYNPKRSINRGSSITNNSSDGTESPLEDYPIEAKIPSRRATHLSNITDLTDEVWEEAEVDIADRSDRSFASDSSPCQQSESTNTHPIFEPAGTLLKDKLSFREGKAKLQRQDSQGEVVSKEFLSYC